MFFLGGCCLKTPLADATTKHVSIVVVVVVVEIRAPRIARNNAIIIVVELGHPLPIRPKCKD